jgi:hypothetical protein
LDKNITKSQRVAILLGVLIALIVLNAAAIYGLMELLEWNFTLSFLTAITAVFAIIKVVVILFRARLMRGYTRLSEESRQRILGNYTRQYKSYRLILFLSPACYILIIVLLYNYAPELKIEDILMNIVVIAVLFYLGIILSVIYSKTVINKIKETFSDQAASS